MSTSVLIFITLISYFSWRLRVSNQCFFLYILAIIDIAIFIYFNWVLIYIFSFAWCHPGTEIKLVWYDKELCKYLYYIGLFTVKKKKKVKFNKALSLILMTCLLFFSYVELYHRFITSKPSLSPMINLTCSWHMKYSV